jgi:hypothetical protein
MSEKNVIARDGMPSEPVTPENPLVGIEVRVPKVWLEEQPDTDRPARPTNSYRRASDLRCARLRLACSYASVRTEPRLDESSTRFAHDSVSSSASQNSNGPRQAYRRPLKRTRNRCPYTAEQRSQRAKRGPARGRHLALARPRRQRAGCGQCDGRPRRTARALLTDNARTSPQASLELLEVPAFASGPPGALGSQPYEPACFIFENKPANVAR